MSRRKKIIIGALILTLAVVVGIGATMAYGPRGSWARGFPPGFHGMGCHPGNHGHDIADFIMWKMDRHVKDLNLNQAQKNEYEKIKEEIKPSMEEHRHYKEIFEVYQESEATLKNTYSQIFRINQLK